MPWGIPKAAGEADWLLGIRYGLFMGYHRLICLPYLVLYRYCIGKFTGKDLAWNI